MKHSKEFKINEFITLKLEGEQTIIYVDGESFNVCKRLVFNIPKEQIKHLKDIKSIDEAELFLKNQEDYEVHIPPEQEFWAHCSNLQAWVENQYNLSILHSSLSYPLLKRLAELDNTAKTIFKEEIVKGIRKGGLSEYSSQTYLEPYPDLLTQEELLYGILNHEEAQTMLETGRITQKLYNRIAALDDLREIFEETRYRNLNDPYDSSKEFYFSEKQGSVEELELMLTYNCSSIPKQLKKLRNLRLMYLYIKDLRGEQIKFDTKLENLIYLKIYCYENLTLPDSLFNFPNLIQLDFYDFSPNHNIELPNSIQKLKKLNSLI